MAADLVQKSGLALVGMGPGKVGSMTAEALAIAKQADIRKYEAYTALWSQQDLAELEGQIGEIEKVMRPAVENPQEILDLARENLVALLVVGDPLQATTHVDLQLQAIEAGVECRVYHGISITTLVTGALGLSNYKFGRQTTLTYPYGGWVATSPLETWAVNDYQGMHTLGLLDLDPTGAGTGNQRPMQPEDAVESLRLMFEKLQDAVYDMPQDTVLEQMKLEACKAFLDVPLMDRVVILASDMGCDVQRIQTTTVGELASKQGGRLNCLVFPANMSDVEEAAIKRWN